MFWVGARRHELTQMLLVLKVARVEGLDALDVRLTTSLACRLEHKLLLERCVHLHELPAGINGHGIPRVQGQEGQRPQPLWNLCEILQVTRKAAASLTLVEALRLQNHIVERAAPEVSHVSGREAVICWQGLAENLYRHVVLFADGPIHAILVIAQGLKLSAGLGRHDVVAKHAEGHVRLRDDASAGHPLAGEAYVGRVWAGQLGLQLIADDHDPAHVVDVSRMILNQGIEICDVFWKDPVLVGIDVDDVVLPDRCHEAWSANGIVMHDVIEAQKLDGRWCWQRHVLHVCHELGVVLLKALVHQIELVHAQERIVLQEGSKVRQVSLSDAHEEPEARRRSGLRVSRGSHRHKLARMASGPGVVFVRLDRDIILEFRQLKPPHGTEQEEAQDKDARWQ
mmetsp:Transcript_75785/g.213448  ORF Transcript_75785/g.213448 Transcript_75785/m.213448 type:complete len:397 (-) Transcript_75785:94-1284(-)